MTNPLLGKRISLVSKKNIRYEGVLYSINEQNATVALQNVKTFGTEGREATEEGCIFVPPADTVHPYLLFRGQDIKDLHVHEPTPEEGIQTEAPVAPEPQPVEAKPAAPPKSAAKPSQPTKQTNIKTQDSSGREEETAGRGINNNRRARTSNNSKAAPGTGASLLNRTARGVVGDSAAQTPQEDFDFQSSLEKFKQKDAEYDNAGAAYEKDDFFDSISCDALDKESGVNNRLKGADERRLNTETFGAVALNTQRRGGAGRGGRGRGREGRGSGSGRGRGRGGRGGGKGRGRGRSIASE